MPALLNGKSVRLTVPGVNLWYQVCLACRFRNAPQAGQEPAREDPPERDKRRLDTTTGSGKRSPVVGYAS